MRSYLRQILHFLILFFRQFFPGHLIVPLLHHTVPGHFGSNGDPVIRILYLLMKSFLSVNCYLPFRPAISIDTVHYYTDHHFLFFRFGFCNHYGQSNKRMIIQSFVPCFIVENAVSVQKIQKHCCCDSFISIPEAMVFRNKIQQISCLFLQGWINLLTRKGLTSDRSLAGTLHKSEHMSRKYLWAVSLSDDRNRPAIPKPCYSFQ